MAKNKQDNGCTVEFPTPYAMIDIRIRAKDVWAKNEIMEWLREKCGLPTEREKQIFQDKCDKIRQSIKSRR